ncbi:hypothetical protein HX870_28520 [Pseudomonas gingeri]|uniref:hypothetical protein n=1 Tax=Pseudomonas gingeri TaxID=117681 RepID=UPI0015A45024|nr:hypothetical protein [Pseudomonas gingeri]NWD71554.1 hypothetical protein [Pseudomonas gingeri]
MNRLVFAPTALLVVGLLVVALPADGAPRGGAPLATPLLAQNLPNSDNPYNSPIRRANPNSLQGSVSSAPPLRGPNTLPTPRPSTIENGAIRNGYPRDTSAPMAVPIQSGTRSDPNTQR